MGGFESCYLKPGGEGVPCECYIMLFLGGYEGVFMGFVMLRRAGDSTPSSVMLLYEGPRRQGLHYFLGRGWVSLWKNALK